MCKDLLCVKGSVSTPEPVSCLLDSCHYVVRVVLNSGTVPLLAWYMYLASPVIPFVAVVKFSRHSVP